MSDRPLSEDIGDFEIDFISPQTLNRWSDHAATLEAERDEYKWRLIAELRDSAKLLYDLNDHDNAGRNEDAADALEEGGGERGLSKRVQNRIPDTRGRR